MRYIYYVGGVGIGGVGKNQRKTLYILFKIYKMYSNVFKYKILKAYPIAIDKDGKLLRFE